MNMFLILVFLSGLAGAVTWALWGFGEHARTGQTNGWPVFAISSVAYFLIFGFLHYGT